MTISTTPPASTVPQVLAYLIEAVKAAVAMDPKGSKILITYADPGSVPDLPNEIINIGGVRRTTNVETFIGGGGDDWLNEKYDIDCIVSTFTGSSDTDGSTTVQLAQIERVWQLLGYVEIILRKDPSLGGLVNIAYPKNALMEAPSWTQSPEGLLAEITFQVHVECLN